MCRLRHADLLDAAHIIRDSDEGGLPVVPNGLALCKIHHAAYDRNILGVRPDLVIDVRRDILDEVDGPMLRHGIQEMAGIRLTVPRQRSAHPDRTNLERRYEEFRAAN
jgi:putative restriction endonuclease